MFERDQEADSEIWRSNSLIENLTSKWKGRSERILLQIIRQRADVNEQLKEPWEPALDDFRGSIGSTPLHFTARLGLVQASKELLTAEADVNASSRKGTTPLMLAAVFGHLEVVKVLLHGKASAMAHDRDGFSPIDLAYLEGRSEIAELLLDHEEMEEEDRMEKVVSVALNSGADLSGLVEEDEKILEEHPLSPHPPESGEPSFRRRRGSKLENKGPEDLSSSLDLGNSSTIGTPSESVQLSPKRSSPPKSREGRRTSVSQGPKKKG